MSNSSLPEHAAALAEVDGASVLDYAASRLSGLAFWTAIALPFLHLPLLATGLESWPTFAAFLVLVALNVLALVVGHPHAADVAEGGD